MYFLLLPMYSHLNIFRENVVSGNINDFHIVSLEKYKHFGWLLFLLSVLLNSTGVLPGTNSHKFQAMDQLT